MQESGLITVVASPRMTVAAGQTVNADETGDDGEVGVGVSRWFGWLDGDVYKDVNGNGKRDAGEPILGDVTLSSRIRLWKGVFEDDVGNAVLFDNCSGDSSSRCILFRPGGGISPPSAGPATPSGGRGIYVADWQGKNYFRVTVESDLSGKCRTDKYVEGSGYSPPSPATKWGWL